MSIYFNITKQVRLKSKLSTFASSFLLLSLCQIFLVVVSASPMLVFCTWAMEVTPTETNHNQTIHLTTTVGNAVLGGGGGGGINPIYYISKTVRALRLVNLAGRILQYGPLNLNLCFSALYFKIKR